MVLDLSWAQSVLIIDHTWSFTQLVSEENNSLKEILKEAVIICEDGNLQDVSMGLDTQEHLYCTNLWLSLRYN